MVAGYGPQPALGMIVGEAPGRVEEEVGRPFAGKTGRALDSALQAIGVAPGDFYATNVVKETPYNIEGEIRRPTPDEIRDWLPILNGEIENTAPAAILALGWTAANVLHDLLYMVKGNVPVGSKVGIVYYAWHPNFVVNGLDKGKWIDQLKPWANAVDIAKDNV